MFEPFRAAPTGAKIANFFILIFLFLSWVSTMVTFGSVLHRMNEFEADINDYVYLDFYWDHYTASGGGMSASNKYCQSALPYGGITAWYESRCAVRYSS